MIYLITNTKSLFNSKEYQIIEFDLAIKELKKLKIVQLDSETSGLDAHSKKILCLQLGNKENQYVFDWASLTPEKILILKEYLESDILLLGWNIAFDFTFLYVQGIYPNHVWDGMIGEQLLWVGYPAGSHSASLQAAASTYLGINMDKTVRGKIITVGLTSEVIVYAAHDVMYLEDIKNKQEKELEKKDLLRALAFENEFVKVFAYIKYCGVRLDVDRWKAKMKKDKDALMVAEKALNAWVVDWSINNPEKSQGVSYKFVSPKNTNEINRLIENKYVKYPEKDIIEFGNLEYICLKKAVGYKYANINYQGDLFEGFNTQPVCNINWSSSKQVIPLFEDLGFDLVTFDKKDKTKKKSVEAKIIKKQLGVSSIAKIYLDYQEAAKVVSTYGENWLRAINPNTKRIYPDYKQLGTDTARLSSGGGPYKINIQNIPHDAETRACFAAEKGNDWISCDYQSQESRIIASVSGDKAMIDLFEHGCGDVHSLVAKMSYPEIIGETKVEDIKSKFHEQRQEAKGIE